MRELLWGSQPYLRGGDMGCVSGGVTSNANDVVSLVLGFALFCAGLPWQSRLIPVCIFLYVFQSFHNLLQLGSCLKLFDVAG
jgi:hypothetical protein